MTMVYFSSAADLVKYVNDNTILQSAIVAIREVDGQWYLFYY